MGGLGHRPSEMCAARIFCRGKGQEDMSLEGGIPLSGRLVGLGEQVGAKIEALKAPSGKL